MNNEELLAQGECPEPNCIEVARHLGPHSYEKGCAMTIEKQIKAMRDEASKGVHPHDYVRYAEIAAYNRVLALLDVLAEVEGWYDNDPMFATVLDRFTEKRESDDAVPATAIFLRRKSDA